MGSRGTGPSLSGEGGNGLIVVGAQGAADKIADGMLILDDKDHTFSFIFDLLHGKAEAEDGAALRIVSGGEEAVVGLNDALTTTGRSPFPGTSRRRGCRELPPALYGAADLREMPRPRSRTSTTAQSSLTEEVQLDVLPVP